jgi:hypothetical protein
MVIPATSDGSGNEIKTASSSGNGTTVTKGQNNSGSQSNNAHVPSDSKSVVLDTKNQNQLSSKMYW